MDSLRNFFQIPLVKFGVHLFLMMGIMLNIYNFYNIFRLENVFENEQKSLALITRENTDAKNQRDYFSSDLYKEKYAKEQNFRKKGEEVIDTSILETVETKNPNYIPEVKTDTSSNIDKWWKCFFGENTIDGTSTSDSVFYSNCRK